MRMTASWSGSNDPTAYKSVARRCTPMASSPRILNRPTDRHRPDTEAMQKARLAVHHRSAREGVKALRNTSDARRQAAKLCYRFGPLTPSARSANLIAGDGTKNGFPAPNKEPAKNQKRPLDRKSPIQVRIHFPPAQSQERTTERPKSGGDAGRAAWAFQEALTALDRIPTDQRNASLERRSAILAAKIGDLEAAVRYAQRVADLKSTRADLRALGEAELQERCICPNKADTR